MDVTVTNGDTNGYTNGDTTVYLHVLGTDRAFSSAVRSDATGEIGAEIKLANGSVVVARCRLSGHGGTVEIKHSNNALTSSGALPTTVQDMPRFAN